MKETMLYSKNLKDTWSLKTTLIVTLYYDQVIPVYAETWALMIFSLADAFAGFHEAFPLLLTLIGCCYQVPSQLFTFTGRDSKDKLQASLKDQKGFHIIWVGD